MTLYAGGRGISWTSWGGVIPLSESSVDPPVWNDTIGIQVLRANGSSKPQSLRAEWGVATYGVNAIVYRVYIRKGTSAPDVFGVDSPFFAFETVQTAVDIYSDATGITRLEYDEAYTVVVRAVNSGVTEDTNTVSLTATVLVADPVTITVDDTVAVFPFVTQYPYTEENAFRTIVSEFESGKEQRRGAWSSPRRVYTLPFNVLKRTDMQTLWEFYQARKGALQTFLLDDLNDDAITLETVDANGDLTTYTGSLADPLVKRDSLLFTIGSTASAIVDNGLGGLTMGDNHVVDVLQGSIDYETGEYSFILASTPGAAIYANYSKQHRVRFADDALSREMLAYQLYRNHVTLLEVK